MTVREVYKTALALMFETETSAGDYADKAPILLNVMLPEVFGINNQLRVFKGLEPLEECPAVELMDDEIILEPEISRAALPYGLAANLLLGDEEEARAGNFFNKYANAMNDCVKLKAGKIVDVYKNEE